MKIWILTVEDRHTDPVLEAYADQAACVAEFTRWLTEEVPEYEQERGEYSDGGEWATWGSEGDRLRYEPVELVEAEA